jgi:hypothetical protein
MEKSLSGWIIITRTVRLGNNAEPLTVGYATIAADAATASKIVEEHILPLEGTMVQEPQEIRLDVAQAIGLEESKVKML